MGFLPPFLFFNVASDIWRKEASMGFRGWLTKNATTVIEKTVEQGKETLSKTVTDKSNLYYTIGRLGLLALLAWLTGKEVNGYLGDGQKQLPQSSNVTVNNYIYDPNLNERSTKE